MSLARFTDLLDAHGADPARWPHAWRKPARALLSSNTEAREKLAEAMKLDALIARHCEHGSEGFDTQAMRVLARLEAPLPPQRGGFLAKLFPAVLLDFDLAPAWPRFAALLGVAALGFALGLSDAGVALTKRSASAITGTASADSDLSLMLFEPDPLSALR